MSIRETGAKPGPTSPRRVRALVVDDSALMRRLLTEILGVHGEIEVVAAARDGQEAIQLFEKHQPDVVTLDVQMPGMSGLDVIPALLAIRPVPIVMVSSLTQEGAEVTLQALERGAVDYVPKPERFQFAEMRQGGGLLIAKVLAAAQSRARRPRATRPMSTALDLEARPREPAGEPPSALSRAVVVIGISTGGPQTLSEVLPELEPPTPPILIVQHMIAGRFTGVLAQRLARHCALEVKEAEEGDRLLPSRVLIANAARHLTIAGAPGQARATLPDGPPVSGHKPSVDVLFHSAAEVFKSTAIGFIMTGMGRDGVDGCKAILAAGGDVYGQDEASSIVYGMNKAAFLEGAVRAQFSPQDMPAILRLLSRKGAR